MAVGLVLMGLVVALVTLFRGLVSGSAMAAAPPQPSTPPPPAAASLGPARASYGAGYQVGYREGRRLAASQKRRLTRHQVEERVDERAARLQSSDPSWIEGYRAGSRFGLVQGLQDRFPAPNLAAHGKYGGQTYEIIEGDVMPLGEASSLAEAKAMADTSEVTPSPSPMASPRPTPEALAPPPPVRKSGIRRVIQPDGTVLYTNE
jgi:hypothetical protein